MAVDMLSYIDRPSPIHRLTGATKLICFILWSSAAMLTYDTGVLLFMLVASIVFFQLSNVRFRDISFVVIVLAIFLVINNIAIYIFAPQQGVAIYGAKHELFHIAGWYNVTLEQLFYQLNITLKYVTVMPAALLFIVTTNPSEFASSLSRIGVSYRISYAVAIALRYIPDIQRDFRTIAISQQARGIDLSKNEKLGKRIKNALSIVMPLIFSSLERIETISNAMELRGFGKHKKRTWFTAKDFQKADYAAALLFVGVVLIVSLVITFVRGTRFYNPF
ncbi:energy-coupling factor transporter transmembrane component T [Bacillus safensis]|uniref:energy-coupling factor transporter transmembrane component T family protein n=1 Tax=Bacillus safensis TaxID=561879 RepID=UPI00227E199F|nr:energy-coupling factor transporter transmembrane component T [Bacillus safensis]MCY7624574.1 energy-coupling factor transporter transmembrane protein EcfT [Bacillus safensis]MCY7653315.1 energy-coupling factor transporter transmembrane protein EcfT [Bacillus safensis]MCY7658423.1 energy-coupling factor transporter transmembrane protein EcfT [Bacillus safensis]MCY7663831.1 energy-coupling factor transporter transmembrane protein EcfT [Bacillus safensis]MCY7668650.1 energy-coupling factor tra